MNQIQHSIPAQVKDITGEKFGRLTVVEYLPKSEQPNPKASGAWWLCECECGNFIKVDGRELRRGNTKSCGCFRKDMCSDLGQKAAADLTGETFGELTVLERIGSNQQNRAMWKCKCSCGNFTIKTTSQLHSYTNLHCGCKFDGKSHGEKKIKLLLEEANIPFQQQYKVEINGKNRFFDFYVDNKYFIEYDGEQHFQPREIFGGEEEFNKTIIRDNEKNKYCQDNNIPLIRISYHNLYSFTLQDLLLN